MRTFVSLFAPVVLCAAAAGQPSATLEPVPTRTPAWQVTLADLNGDGRDEAIYAGYDGELTCLDRAAGKTLWTADLGGFPYCLTTADLDGDGRPEVLATSASLFLHVFSPTGKLLWKFASGAPLHAVAAGRMLGRQDVQVVCGGEDMTLYILSAKGKKLKTIPIKVAPNIEAINNLAIGDVAGDSANELCMTNGFGVVRLIDPRTGKTIWNSRNYKRRFMRDLALWDADGDGQQEVLATSDRVELLDGDGKTLWQQKPAFTRSRGYTMAEAEPVDMDNDGRQEMAVLFGPQLSVFNAQGKRVYQQACDFTYFTTLAGHRTPSNEIVLGSVVGADRNLYALTFTRGGRDEFAAFKPEYGYINTINANLATLRAQVLAAPADPNLPDRTYDIWISGGSPPLKQMGWVARQLNDFRAAYPYKNLRFNAFVQYREPGYKGQGKELPVEELLQIASRLERAHATHVLAVAHGLDPFMSVGMVRRWLDAAPTTCRGIMMHENSHPVSHFKDGNPKLVAQIDSFIDGFMLPVMDVCLEKKKRFYLMEKQLWWAAVPAVKKYADRIFAPKYRSIIVPMVEESNSRCPQLNFVARVGLWRMGAVQRWGLNLIDDQLRTCKLYEYNLGDAHSALRHYVAYAAAGATELKLGKMMYVFRTPRGKEKPGTEVGALSFRQTGLLAFDTFMHLLGKGLVVPPTREEIVGVSPVAFRMQKPADGFWLSATIRDPAAISPLSRNGLFSGHDWGLTRPHPYYASSYLMNTKRYGHQVIPENPYGLPVILPPWPESGHQAWAKDTVDTDGVHMLKGGRRVRAKDAKPEILDRFAKGAAELPFTAAGVYWMARKTGEGTYRVVLVDPGFLTPADRNAKLKANAPYRIAELADALSGETLAVQGGAVSVHVPAGALRLLDLKLSR